MTGLFFAFFPEKINGLQFHSLSTASAPSFTHKIAKTSDAYMEGRFLNKFLNDKRLCETETHIVGLDGVILNLTALLRKYGVNSLEELLFRFADAPEQIASEMRGTFCGIIADKANKTVSFFTDHFACKTLYYYQRNDLLIVASEVASIVAFLKENKIPYSLDYAGAYSLLTYAYMYQDITLIQEIRRVKEGTTFYYDAHGLRKVQYHAIRDATEGKTAKALDEREAVEQIDALFTDAVRLQHQKNQEYGYVDVAPLSAGMDSRMTNYALRRISDRDIISFTYSQSGEFDDAVPKKIASELKNRWLFKSLDNGLDMMEIERAIPIADGMIYYLWPAQLHDALMMWNTERWGVVHTGVIGDVVIASFYRSPKDIHDYRLGDGAYSSTLISKFAGYLEDSKRESQHYELGMMMNRAINGACMGYSTSFRRCAEDMSPFMNVDFFDYCLSLPLELRMGHRVYYAWVKAKYPDAAKYPHNGISIRGNQRILIHGRSYPLLALPDLVRVARRKLRRSGGMNPVQYWYDTNPTLKARMDGYFAEHCSALEPYAELYQDTRHLYETGSAMEKTLAISLAGSMGLLFE